MKKTAYFVALVFVAVFLSSCASGPKFTKVQPSLVPDAPENGRIFFYRPSSVGAAVIPKIMLNDENVGKAVAKGFFYIDVPPGDYVVVTATEVKRKVSFTMEPGQTRYVRFSISMGFFVGHVYGKIVDEETALKELKKCKLIET